MNSFFEWLDKEISLDGVGRGSEDAESWYKVQAEVDKNYFRREYEAYKKNVEIGE